MAGFTVKTTELRAAGADIDGLQSRCETIAGDSIGALVGMASNAGHPGVASALANAADQADKAFFAAGQTYLHISQAYTASADNYDGAENTIAARARTIQTWFRP
jgi:hypothetical protein